MIEERRNIDPDPLNQYVHHPYYVDAVAVRYYDATVSGTQVRHFYCHDANFNVTSVVNSGGIVQERYAYSPYEANPGPIRGQPSSRQNACLSQKLFQNLVEKSHLLCYSVRAYQINEFFGNSGK